MPVERRSLVAFNRGIISTLGLARTDLPRTALSAEIMTNWQPRTLGSMMLRPGTEYIANTIDNLKEKTVAFIFSATVKAQLHFVEGAMQVSIDDEAITRVAVTAAVTNGDFLVDISGWTDNDEVGGLSAWAAGGYMALLGDGTNAAIRDQTVVVAETNVEHALRIVVYSGPVTLRVGSTTALDEYVSETTLGTGTHSLAFTPTGNFNIRLMSRRGFTSFVSSVAVESAGVMELTTPWLETDLPLLRFDQSGDVIYVACAGYQQRKIERRAAHSWSIVLYEPETGPFRRINTTPVTMSVSAITGDITVTSSANYFKQTNVGSLLRIESVGQSVSDSFSTDNDFSGYIRVAGVGGQRAFGISITGTFVATLTLQYSVSAPGSWVDVTTYTVPTSTSYNDGLDNNIVYYRIGIKTAGYTSGTAVIALSYTAGSIIGVARLTGYGGPTSMQAQVLQDFGAITASSDWWEGKWSHRRGWPSAVTLHESRVMMFGIDIDGTITDAYEDYDDEFEGDAGPINRTIGSGPVESIVWALSMTRLVMGTLSSSANIAALKIQGNHPVSGRSSSLDEPLTPTNFTLKTASPTAVFVDTSLTRLLELKFDINENDYVPEDLSVAVPDLNEEANIVGIAVQYKPDLRIWCWRSDGTVAVLTRDRAENVTCWFEVETDGEIEDVSVLPDTVEDRVYWNVKRSVNGSDVRYREKVALEMHCRGGTQNRQADAFIAGTNSPASATITGLGIHEGEEVIVWADGVDFSPDDDDGVQRTYTVSGGAITLDSAVTDYVVGRGYEARWKSGKLAFATALGSSLNVLGKIPNLGLILLNTHARGLKYGAPSDVDIGEPGYDEFADLDDLPLTEDDEEVDEDHIWDTYDKEMMTFDGNWSTDPRVLLLARAPRPVTVSAITVPLTKNG